MKLALKRPGLIVPPLTPFHDDGSVDYELLKKEIDYIIASSAPAAVAAAAVEAQEYHYLDFASRIELIHRTAEALGGRVPLIVGASHPSFRTAVTLAHEAEKVGAQAIQLLIPLRPSGGQPTLREVADYFDIISRETSLPIVAYNNPGPGLDTPTEWMIELAQHDSVVAFKESSRNLRRVGLLIRAMEDPGLAMYFTTMEMLLATLQLGGSGGTMPPPGSALAAQLIRAYQEGDLAACENWQNVFTRFPGRWASMGIPAISKAAMEAVGLGLGQPYPPFAPVSVADRKAIVEELTPYRAVM